MEGVEFSSFGNVFSPKWENSAQFCGWIPKYVAELLDAVVDYLMALSLQASMHGISLWEVVLSGKKPLTIDHTMCGQSLRARMHGPTHHTGTHAGSEKMSNGSITRHPAPGYQLHDGINIFKEIVFTLFLTHRTLC